MGDPAGIWSDGTKALKLVEAHFVWHLARLTDICGMLSLAVVSLTFFFVVFNMRWPTVVAIQP